MSQQINRLARISCLVLITSGLIALNACGEASTTDEFDTASQASNGDRNGGRGSDDGDHHGNRHDHDGDDDGDDDSDHDDDDDSDHHDGDDDSDADDDGGSGPTVGDGILECTLRGCYTDAEADFNCETFSVSVESCKDLSNVVLDFGDGNHQKFDNLSGYTGTFAGTGDHEGLTIVGVWIKSGRYRSGDGPGYGYRIDAPTCEPPTDPGPLPDPGTVAGDGGTGTLPGDTGTLPGGGLLGGGGILPPLP